MKKLRDKPKVTDKNNKGKNNGAKVFFSLKKK
jgi:hypothetical protein